MLGVEAGVILAAVVDEHDFKARRVVLAQEQGQQLAQVVELIAGADDDGHGLLVVAARRVGRPLGGAAGEGPEVIAGEKELPQHRKQQQAQAGREREWQYGNARMDRQKYGPQGRGYLCGSAQFYFSQGCAG